MPESEVAIAVATRRPATLRRLSSLKSEPKKRLVNSAINTASAALQTAKIAVLARFRSPSRLAAIVATITPAATGNRAFGPNAIRYSGRDAGGGPEHRHSIGFGQERKAQSRGEGVGDGDGNREPDRADP